MFQTTKILLVLLLLSPLVSQKGYTQNTLEDISIYPFGGTYHFNRTPKNNDGNLDYLGISKSIKKDSWMFENGVGTFIDSYHLRSYIVFSNISYDTHKLGLLKPMLNLHCAYRGYSYNNDDRRIQCYPALKFRIGKEKGLFTNITPIPKIKGLTDGQITFEVGYKF
jgi:hypothetical protein